MLDFKYHNPVKITFGKSALDQLPSLVKTKKKILLVYGGGSIHKNGVYNKVLEAINQINVVDFGGIEPNPQFETLLKAVKLGRKEEVDFILAVGGGSVIDGAKFISAAIPFKDEDLWKVVTRSTLIETVIPFGTILTLPATGSEMNPYSVISRKELGVKRDFEHDLLFPEFSLLDPSVTFSLSSKQIGNGVVDAFVHTIEQYLTYPVNTPLQDRMAEGILSTLIEEGPKTFKDPEGYDSRANLMWCATMALNGLISKGTVSDWSTHGIGHELTVLFGIDHARTLAVVLPGLLRVLKEKKREKLLQFAERIWNIKTDNEDEKIEQAISKTEVFFQSVGVPTKLKDYEIKEEDIAQIAERFNRRNPLGEHKNIDAAMVKTILLANLK